MIDDGSDDDARMQSSAYSLPPKYNPAIAIIVPYNIERCNFTLVV